MKNCIDVSDFDEKKTRKMLFKSFHFGNMAIPFGVGEDCIWRVMPASFRRLWCCLWIDLNPSIFLNPTSSELDCRSKDEKWKAFPWEFYSQFLFVWDDDVPAIQMWAVSMLSRLAPTKNRISKSEHYVDSNERDTLAMHIVQLKKHWRLPLCSRFDDFLVLALWSLAIVRVPLFSI